MTRKKKKIFARLRRSWRDLWSVTPTEWVKVQIFCAAVAGSIGIAWDKVEDVFGDDPDAVKIVMKSVMAACGVIAAYAQTKAKRPSEFGLHPHPNTPKK
jgi:hypothetical protein